MMKLSTVLLSATLMVAPLGITLNANADTTNASCIVYPKGEDRASWSGPCTFSQRQGYVGIQLQNGKRYELSPTGQPNKFRDQNGRPAHRETGASDQQIYRLSKESIFVTFDQGASGQASQERKDAFETVCGVMVNGKNYRYRCKVEDFYSGSRKTKTVLYFPDQTLGLVWKSGNVVELNFEGMVPKTARYSTSEGETNFRFEDKTYFYISNKAAARREVENFRN